MRIAPSASSCASGPTLVTLVRKNSVKSTFPVRQDVPLCLPNDSNAQAVPCFSLFSTPKSAVSPRRVVGLANKEEAKSERTGIDSGVDWETSRLPRQVKRGLGSYDKQILRVAISGRFFVRSGSGSSGCQIADATRLAYRHDMANVRPNPYRVNHNLRSIRLNLEESAYPPESRRSM
jgi:hypothetical protein